MFLIAFNPYNFTKSNLNKFKVQPYPKTKVLSHCHYCFFLHTKVIRNISWFNNTSILFEISPHYLISCCVPRQVTLSSLCCLRNHFVYFYHLLLTVTVEFHNLYQSHVTGKSHTQWTPLYFCHLEKSTGRRSLFQILDYKLCFFLIADCADLKS